MELDNKSLDFQAYEYLLRLKNELGLIQGKLEYKIWNDIIDENIKRIKNKKYRTAVVGEFKRGKSSLINALLGRNIFPVDATPATATINRITFGVTPRAYLTYKNGTQKEIKIEELSQYVTKLTEESKQEALTIQEAVVEYPTMFCQNYVDLIDTPGMSDDCEMNKTTAMLLEDIDLVIVAISAISPLSETEITFLVSLLENSQISQIIIVITYIDLIREKDRNRLKDFIKERVVSSVYDKLLEKYKETDAIFLKYKKIFGHLELFAVSSVDALEAREKNDDVLFEKSGFVTLDRELPKIILGNQNIDTVIKIMDKEQKIIQKYYNFLFALPKMKKEVLSVVRMKEDIFTKGLIVEMIEKERCVERKFMELLTRWKENIIADFTHRIMCMKRMGEEEIYHVIMEGMKYNYQKYKAESDYFFHETLWCEYREILEYNQQRHKEIIQQVIEECDIKFSDSFESVGNVDCALDKIKEKMNDPQFGWSISLVPESRKVKSHNIIKYVRNAIQKSMDDFKYRCLKQFQLYCVRFEQVIRFEMKTSFNLLIDKINDQIAQDEKIVAKREDGRTCEHLKQLEIEIQLFCKQLNEMMMP